MTTNNYNIILYTALGFLVVAFAISLYRVIKGPTESDRVVAMDLNASIIMGFIAIYAILVNNSRYFDVILVISLISFIATVAVSTYLKQRK